MHLSIDRFITFVSKSEVAPTRNDPRATHCRRPAAALPPPYLFSSALPMFGSPAAPERSEADEVKELKAMFSANKRKPPWDSTPLRNRPSALIGLKPVTREPWAIDEDVYNRRFETRDVGIQGVHACDAARALQQYRAPTATFSSHPHPRVRAHPTRVRRSLP